MLYDDDGISSIKSTSSFPAPSSRTVPHLPYAFPSPSLLLSNPHSYFCLASLCHSSPSSPTSSHISSSSGPPSLPYAMPPSLSPRSSPLFLLLSPAISTNRQVPFLLLPLAPFLIFPSTFPPPFYPLHSFFSLPSLRHSSSSSPPSSHLSSS